MDTSDWYYFIIIIVVIIITVITIIIIAIGYVRTSVGYIRNGRLYQYGREFRFKEFDFINFRWKI